MGLDQVIVLTPRENFRLTRERVKPQPSPSDKVNCPFCKLEMTRRGIVQHVSHSHADHFEKFRKDKSYKEILPFKCDSCKLQFAGKESLRKHFNARGNRKSTCQKPEDDPETADPVKNIGRKKTLQLLIFSRIQLSRPKMQFLWKTAADPESHVPSSSAECQIQNKEISSASGKVPRL